MGERITKREIFARYTYEMKRDKPTNQKDFHTCSKAIVGLSVHSARHLKGPFEIPTNELSSKMIQ